MLTKLQYVEFLISTVAHYTGTYWAEHLDQVRHDTITDFLPSERFTTGQLWELVPSLIADSHEVFLLVDDSIQDKRQTVFPLH